MRPIRTSHKNTRLHRWSSSLTRRVSTRKLHLGLLHLEQLVEDNAKCFTAILTSYVILYASGATCNNCHAKNRDIARIADMTGQWASRQV